jgi:hypothetical protein
MTKDALLQHYTSFEGFYSQYFDGHRVLQNGEWQVLCPFHEDKNPSMTVNPKTGLFNCFACGAKGGFIDFYMKQHGVDFSEAIKKMCADAGIHEQKPQIVKTYDYTDHNGKLITQTVRYEPKKFSQRAMQNGQWVWSLKGVNTVLYNMPAILKADIVLIMEGEKDCDTAKSIGITATTCPMGAGKWREWYNAPLAGKIVVLVPDNDSAGIKHMIQVGNALKSQSIVKWLEFPGENKKGYDFTDFVNGFENEFEAMNKVDALIRSARIFDDSKIIIPVQDSPESEKIKKWVKSSPGEFSVRDVDYDLGFSTPEQKIARTAVLEKFVAEKVLSREGKHRGVYRPYQAALESMDFKTADDKFLPLWLPMGIHKMVGIMPGNIVVLAGEANAGKTAMMLNIIKSNMNKFDVHYFNSEMGAGELKSRLSKFEGLSLDDWTFNAYSRDSDFADVVFTGEKSLNIIDFLEVHDDFYLVGEKIKQIHLALNGGIAIIAIQKNKGSEFAVGGNRTMEKARLVVNVEPGKFKITKAKNFINSALNPNGLMCDWKLVDGCRFVMKGSEWYRKE